MADIKEKIDEALETVKETVEEKIGDTLEIIKEKTEDAKEKIETTVETVKSKTEKRPWLNRIIAAIIGAIIAAAAAVGITYTHVNEQKLRTENIKSLTIDALNAIKAGDLETAKTALELASSEGKDLVSESKKIITNIKQYTDK